MKMKNCLTNYDPYLPNTSLLRGSSPGMQKGFHSQLTCMYAKGVPFSTYMYVPEEHPILKHEREDLAGITINCICAENWEE